MTDPLTLLKSFNINKKEIIERDDLIVFDDVSWPKNTKTNYVAFKSGSDGGPKQYYTLECLNYLLKNANLSHPAYVRQAEVTDEKLTPPSPKCQLDWDLMQCEDEPPDIGATDVVITTADSSHLLPEIVTEEEKAPRLARQKVEEKNAKQVNILNPLRLLKDYHKETHKIIERDGKIILGKSSWPKTFETHYVAFGSGKHGEPKHHYTLECLVYFLKNKHLHHHEYVRQAEMKRIPVIRRYDRKNIVAYLTQASRFYD